MIVVGSFCLDTQLESGFSDFNHFGATEETVDFDLHFKDVSSLPEPPIVGMQRMQLLKQ